MPRPLFFARAVREARGRQTGIFAAREKLKIIDSSATSRPICAQRIFCTMHTVREPAGIFETRSLLKTVHTRFSSRWREDRLFFLFFYQLEIRPFPFCGSRSQKVFCELFEKCSHIPEKKLDTQKRRRKAK